MGSHAGHLPDDDWAGHAHQALADAGYRRGGARRAVIDLLGRQPCAVSAQDIEDQLRQEGSGVGRASVYRVLEQLAELGLVQRLDIGQGTTRYEPAHPSGDHHHHLVCDACGRVTPFEDAALERAISGLSGRMPFAVETHDVVLRGRCDGCA